MSAAPQDKDRVIDKNSLWGGLNIQKGESFVKEKILCLFGGHSAGIRGILRVGVGRGCLQRFDEDRQALLRFIRAHHFLPPRIPDLYDVSRHFGQIRGSTS